MSHSRVTHYTFKSACGFHFLGKFSLDICVQYSEALEKVAPRTCISSFAPRNLTRWYSQEQTWERAVKANRKLIIKLDNVYSWAKMRCVFKKQRAYRSLTLFKKKFRMKKQKSIWQDHALHCVECTVANKPPPWPSSATWWCHWRNTSFSAMCFCLLILQAGDWTD